MESKAANQEQEEWRPVAGAEGWYEVSSFGRVKRVKSYRAKAGRILNGSFWGAGYRCVNLCMSTCRRVESIHRLVAEAFIAPIPNGHEVNHKDGNKTNNHISNLEVITLQENRRHAQVHGLLARGEKRRDTKLKDADVLLIRYELINTMTQEEIAARFGVSRRAIGYLLQGVTYSHCVRDQETVNAVLARSRIRPWTRKCSVCACFLSKDGSCRSCARRQ